MLANRKRDDILVGNMNYSPRKPRGASRSVSINYDRIDRDLEDDDINDDEIDEFTKLES